MKVAVIAATNSMALQLIPQISDRVERVLALARSPEKLSFASAKIEAGYCDLAKPGSIKLATQDCEVVVSLAHSRYTETILKNIASSVRRVVIVGSTWKFTRFPNERAEQVRQAEELLHQWSGETVMIHPSMIYGAKEEDTVRRLLSWVKTKSWIPLPDGGRALVQPALSDDIVDALDAAIFNSEMIKKSYIVASHQPVSYSDMVKTCAHLQNKGVRILPVPTFLMRLGAKALSVTPWRQKLKTDQVDR
ncbi:MAG: hypothetical protein MJK18_14500 [Bdellovibrionales bacterium]|nr:hypothetical protein [Bdellovibrionales bacterium]